MKASAISIHWHHENAPIYSVNFQPLKSGTVLPRYRLATAGGDNNVRIWQIDRPESFSGTSDPSPNNISNLVHVTYLSTLVKHTQAVNVVRFDPSGSVLASAGDDGTIVLWTLSANVTRVFGEDNFEDKESWRPQHVCRHSLSEIYDLAWSPDSRYILAGSMDNVARIYNASTGQCIRELAEHSHYVQGVAWDPYNEYLATQSSDRSIHTYNLKGKDGSFVLGSHHRTVRADLPVLPFIPTESKTQTIPPTASSETSTVDQTPSHQHDSSTNNTSTSASSSSPSFIPQTPHRSNDSQDPPEPLVNTPVPKSSYLYHNETFTSFFRRLTFSPDGSLLLTPSGVYKYPNGNANFSNNSNPQDTNANTTFSSDEITNTVYIYTRAGLNRPPVAHLPGLKKPSLAVCCSPIFYKLRGTLLGTKKESNGSNHAKPSSPSHSSSPVFALPYRVVYAVITQDTVVVYDTEQHQPIAVVSNLNYSAFTDATWSPDGQSLFVTSVDGFCSAILFDKNELGERYEGKVGPPSASLSSTLDSAVETANKDNLPTNTLKQNTRKTLDSPRKNHIFGESIARQLSLAEAHPPTKSKATVSSNNKPEEFSSSNGPSANPTLSENKSTESSLQEPESTNEKNDTNISSTTTKRTGSEAFSNGNTTSTSSASKKKKKRIVPTLVSKPTQ